MSESENKAPQQNSIPEPEAAEIQEAEVVAHGDDEELEACCVLNSSA